MVCVACQVEALLGPKTEADLKPAEPKKKVKAAKVGGCLAGLPCTHC